MTDEPTDADLDLLVRQGAWEHQANTLMYAALGRAESDLCRSEITGGMFRGMTHEQMCTMRVAMLAAAATMRHVLRESGWMLPLDAKEPTDLPPLVKDHARQAQEVYKRCGLSDPAEKETLP